MADITLYHFCGSHYNEKARWALDLKDIPHDRVSLLPGPHAPRMKRLTGRTETPVLVDGDEVVAGSATILAHLERRFPDPPLEPSDPVERERAFALAQQFDTEVGPAVRLAKFFEVMSGVYATRMFASEKGLVVKAAYRASFPLVAGVMKRSMGINAANAARARERIREALDAVAAETKGSRYLVGDRFSLADLTCAALLMPAVDVSDLGGPASSDTEAERTWFEQWAEHPGAAWVRETYRAHRHA